MSKEEKAQEEEKRHSLRPNESLLRLICAGPDDIEDARGKAAATKKHGYAFKSSSMNRNGEGAEKKNATLPETETCVRI